MPDARILNGAYSLPLLLRDYRNGEDRSNASMGRKCTPKQGGMFRNNLRARLQGTAPWKPLSNGREV